MGYSVDDKLDPERIRAFKTLLENDWSGSEMVVPEEIQTVGGNAGKNKGPRVRDRHLEEDWFKNKRKANRKRNKMQKQSRQKNR